MPSVVIGDDRRLLVESLTVALPRFGLPVAATARDLTELVAAVRRIGPDVCVLAQGLLVSGPGNGIAEVRTAHPRIGVVMLIAALDVPEPAPAGEWRADGYVNMARGCTDLVKTIHRVATGEVVDLETWRRPPVVPAPGRHARTLIDQLTDREQQCLVLLVDGQPTELMAGQLGVSVTTVRSHVQALMNKLGVHSRLEAAAYAVRHALVTPPGAPHASRRRAAAPRTGSG